MRMLSFFFWKFNEGTATCHVSLSLSAARPPMRNHLYESFFAGCIPLILSDRYVLPFQVGGANQTRGLQGFFSASWPIIGNCKTEKLKHFTRHLKDMLWVYICWNLTFVCDQKWFKDKSQNVYIYLYTVVISTIYKGATLLNMMSKKFIQMIRNWMFAFLSYIYFCSNMYGVFETVFTQVDRMSCTLSTKTRSLLIGPLWVFVGHRNLRFLTGDKNLDGFFGCMFSL